MKLCMNGQMCQRAAHKEFAIRAAFLSWLFPDKLTSLPFRNCPQATELLCQMNRHKPARQQSRHAVSEVRRTRTRNKSRGHPCTAIEGNLSPFQTPEAEFSFPRDLLRSL